LGESCLNDPQHIQSVTWKRKTSIKQPDSTKRNSNQKDKRTMKHMQTLLKSLAALALTVLIVGCASAFQEKKDIAVAAGFKVITPTKPDHVALLPTLAKNKVTEIQYEGKTFYVLPDLENNRAYVGGPAEYQAYKQLSLQKQIAEDQLAAAQMNQMATMNWGAWGGWGGVGYGGYGGYGRVGYGRVGVRR
jgi:hypothetical protein